MKGMKNILKAANIQRKPRKSQAQREAEDEEVKSRMNLVKKDSFNQRQNAANDEDSHLEDYYKNKAKRRPVTENEQNSFHSNNRFDRVKSRYSNEESGNFDISTYKPVHEDDFSARMQMFQDQRDAEEEDGFGPAPRRSTAFNDVLFGEDGPLKFGSDFGQEKKVESLFGFEYEKKDIQSSADQNKDDQEEPKKELELSSESDGADFDSRFKLDDLTRGSEKGMVVEREVKEKDILDKDDDVDAEEEGDTVNEIESFFEQKQLEYGQQRRRVITQNVKEPQVKKESDKNRNSVPQSLDERIELLVGPSDVSPILRNTESVAVGSFENRERPRMMSVVQQRRQGLKKAKEEQDKKDGEQAPAQAQIDQKAKQQVDRFLQRNDTILKKKEEKKVFGNTEQDFKLIKELLVYQAALDGEYEIEKAKAAAEDNNIFQNDDFLMPNSDADSDDATGFLTDFYKELDLENDGQKQMNSELFRPKVEEVRTKENYQSKLESIEALRGAMIPFIDKNERSHQLEAKQNLKSNVQLQGEKQQLVIISQQVLREKEMFGSQLNQKTSYTITMNDDLYIIGNSFGELKMYGKEDQDLYATYKEKGKEFANNGITSIAVHPTRPDYIVIGYQQGQLILFDVCNVEKSLKIIKDAHKGFPIANIQFCDLIPQKKDKPEVKTRFGNQLNQIKELGNKIVNKQDSYRADSNVINPYGPPPDDSLNVSHLAPEESAKTTTTKVRQGDEQEWMFISIDSNGKVVINYISKVVFIFKSSKQILVEPIKDAPKFLSLGCRFRNILHPQIAINDFVTLVAIGSSTKVIVLAITKEKSQIVKEFDCPKYRSAINEIKELNTVLPSITWGYGHSPMMKDKCYATLVIGWGPLIQMYVLNDITDQKQTFIEDGFYVIQQQSELQDDTNSPSSENNRSRDTSTTSDDIKQRQVLEQINPYEQQSRFEAIQQEMIQKRNNSLYGRELSPFEMHSLFIEEVSYLSDSVLLILTKSLQYKIYYTQKFHYGLYSHEEWRSEQKVPGSDKKKGAQSIVDEGNFEINLAQSEYGPSYRQTFCQFNGLIIALGVKGMFKINQIRWDESLQTFKKIANGNWILEIARAIDIYTGRVKGFKDVPEEQFMRQETMKADLKLYIRTIISEQLELWSQEETNTQNDKAEMNADGFDESHLDLLNMLDSQKTSQTTEKMAKYRTLFAIAIEFCVTISDWYFLFYDLFLLFEEEQLADVFLDELKPFIMAGRFSEHDLPNDILQNHIVNYYKDPHQPEQIEKIIINLKLSDCPKSAITELIQFSEENFLSTALLYLHTSIYDPKDEESCQRLILALLHLYREAKKTNPGSFEQLRQISNLSPDSIERLRAEKSQLYIGYKVLWVIRLFLNGKMFPQGNIPEARWRKYVHEIVDCITRENVMLDLLTIDAEAYFQIISILFFRGKVFEFLREDKLQQNRVIQTQQSLVEQPVISNDMYEERQKTIILSHNQILARFEKVCSSRHENDYKVPDDIRLQYLFFVANVASKSNIKKDAKFYLSCMKELLDQSQNFLKFNKTLMNRALNRRKNIGQLDNKIKDENKHIYVSETALIDLMDLCEPLSDQEVEDLLEKTKNTRFNQLRVKLLEKKEDYVECLRLYVDGMRQNSYAASKRESINRVFDWINNILDAFMAKKTAKNQEATAAEDALRKQIMIEFSGLVNIDSALTFLLIEEKFDSDHERFIKTLSESYEQQYKYLETMLTTHHDQIQSSLEAYYTSGLQGADRDRAEGYMRLQNMHLRLLCEHYPDKVLDRVRRIKKNEIHFALDDCLGICQEYNQVEACAMFTNKMGNYYASITQYMNLLKDKKYFDYPQLLRQICQFGQNGKQIPYFVPYLDKATKLKNKEIMKSNDKDLCYMVRFDYIIRKVMKVIGKESNDNFNDEATDKIWFFTLDSILPIKYEQTRMIEDLRDLLIQKIEENQLLIDEDKKAEKEAVLKKYNRHIKSLDEFFKSRIAYAIEHTLKWIELDKFLAHIVGHDEDIEFNELKDMIISIFTEVSSEQVVLKNANRSANQYIVSSFAQANQERSSGILFRYRQCGRCNKFLDEIAIEQRKQNELAQFRRGTVMQRSTYGSGDSDEDDFDMPYIDPFNDELTLYDCGHAFHIKCIEAYIAEQNQANQQHLQGKRKQPVVIPSDQFEKQQCPTCFSEKFKIDFETVFATAKSRGIGPNRQAKGSRADSPSNSPVSEEIVTSSEFGKPQRRVPSDQERHERKLSRQRQRHASVARKQRSLKEQKLDFFGNTFKSEGVTLFNFKM